MIPKSSERMQVRVLGCSGAIAKGCRTTSFLLDDDLLVDAGTGVGELTLDEMAAVDDVVLTHSHMDHIAALPLMLDAVWRRRATPLRVHALAGTLDALRRHVFNDVIWPNFACLPSRDMPSLSFHEISVGQTLQLGARAVKQVEVLSAVHTVPACGYAVRRAVGGANWVFSGDTDRNEAFWQRVNALDVGCLIIEAAFSSRDQALAELCKHLSPASLAEGLARIAVGQRYPIYITHTKPAETHEIMGQIEALGGACAAQSQPAHDIRWLRAGDVLEV